MPISVRALCTRSVDDLTPEDLRRGAASRLPAIAPIYGEEDPAATVPALVIDGMPPLLSWSLRYGADACVPIVRRAAVEDVRAVIAPLEGALADADEPEAADVLALLADTVEVVTLELAMADVEGIGWALAVAVAATVAARGRGLVQADGEGYLEPKGRSVVHVLDGD